MAETLLTLDELCDQLVITKPTVYRWRHEGRGPRAIRIGRHLRFRQADVDAWLDQQADPQPAAS